MIVGAFDVHVDFKGLDQITHQLGLEPGGKIQEEFAYQIMRISDKYTPMDSAAVLRSQVFIVDGGTALEYRTPYARYHWYGKLMVDPITRRGFAWHNPETGQYWSRPGVNKLLTDKDLNYQGAPIRGPKWVERAWIDNGQQVIDQLQRRLDEQSK